MAIESKFYLEGPYLHNPHGMSRVDMFEKNKALLRHGSIDEEGKPTTSSEYWTAIARLKGILKQAEEIEKSLYSALGVENIAQLNELVFSIQAQLQADGVYTLHKLDELSLPDKVASSINNRQILAIIMGARKEGFEKVKEIILDNYEQTVFEEFFNSTENIMGDQQDALFLKLIEKLSQIFDRGFTTSTEDTLRSTIMSTIISSTLKFDKIEIPPVKQTAGENVRAFNARKRKARQEQEEAQAKYLKFLQRSIGFVNAADVIRKNLIFGADGNKKTQIQPKDFNMSDNARDSIEFLQKREQYAKRIAKEFVKRMLKLSGTIGIVGTEISGDLGEGAQAFAINVILDGNLEGELPEFAKLIGRDMAYLREGSEKQLVEGPADIAMGIGTNRTHSQIKNRLSDRFFDFVFKDKKIREHAGGAMTGQDLNVRLKSGLTNIDTFFNEMETRGLISSNFSPILVYEFVNSVFRGEDELLEYISTLLNLVTEYFVKSAYMEPVVEWATGQLAGEMVIENHFYIHATQGIYPMSMFLRHAIEILEVGGKTLDTSSLFTVFDPSAMTLGARGFIDPEVLRREKLDLLENLRYSSGGKGYDGALKYPEPLLRKGRRYGAMIQSNIRLPDITISANSLGNILARHMGAITRGG